MAHSLTDMIDEVNDASSKVSSIRSSTKAGADDPLTPIVRVLNGHLNQLQSIDAGAAELEKKVEQAQKDMRVVDSQTGLNGCGWVADFGKSFLGRR